jgi:NADPH:quinone reductase-like Zn-dependent oxidoreductase
MNAVLYSRYGSPDVLQLRDVEKPVPRDNEVLIEVRAASVNPADWHFMRGTPYIARIGMMIFWMVRMRSKAGPPKAIGAAPRRKELLALRKVEMP